MRKPAIEDLLTITGVGLIAYGCWLVYPPAGFIALGAQMVGLSFLILLSRAKAPAKAGDA